MLAGERPRCEASGSKACARASAGKTAEGTWKKMLPFVATQKPAKWKCLQGLACLLGGNLSRHWNNPQVARGPLSVPVPSNYPSKWRVENLQACEGAKLPAALRSAFLQKKRRERAPGERASQSKQRHPAAQLRFKNLKAPLFSSFHPTSLAKGSCWAPSSDPPLEVTNFG